MENEKTGGVRAAEHRPLCLCILAIGALFAWWNLYHDDGFLFLSNYLNQVESCLACYGGALGAFALIVGAGRAGDGASVPGSSPSPLPKRSLVRGSSSPLWPTGPLAS